MDSIIVIWVIAVISIYMTLYFKKGQDKSLIGYVGAFFNAIGLAVIFAFIIAGIYIIKVCLTQPLYEGLIVPLAWLIIAYNLIKNILNNDFGLNIHIIKPTSKVLNILKNNSDILFYIIFIIVFLAVAINIFVFVLPNEEMYNYGALPVFISGCIFLFIALVFTVITCARIKGKSLRRIEKGHIVEILLFGMSILCGILSLYFGIYESNEYKNKTGNYIETYGEYVGGKIYSQDSDEGTTYTLLYSYEVDGEKYEVSSYYATQVIPEEGAKSIVLYDPDNPKEAVLKGNPGKFLMILGIAFIGAPMFLIAIGLIERIKNQKIQQMLMNGVAVFINVVFIVLGVGIYKILCGGMDYSLLTAVKVSGAWILCPILFIIAGTINLVWCIIKMLETKK